jgi:hypothetical protein
VGTEYGSGSSMGEVEVGKGSSNSAEVRGYISLRKVTSSSRVICDILTCEAGV